MEQRTVEWYRARLGRVTGSRAGDLMGKGRGCEFSKTALEYIASVAAERLLADEVTGSDIEMEAYLDEVSVTSRAMRVGTEREPEARELYAELRGITVEEVGSLSHPTIAGFASSPDGIVTAEDGGMLGCIEIKCPKPAAFFTYLTKARDAAGLKEANPVYYWQCMSHMAVTGTAWCDFVAYCPYMSTPMHIVRIRRDAEAIALLESRVRLALDRVEALVKSAAA